MSAQALTYRFAPAEFVRAWEAGAFSERVELVEGDVWPVSVGDWHAETTMCIGRALPNDDVTFTSASLVTASSVPDPDCWVRRSDAVGAGQLGARLTVWSPEDVLLVVEVSDETEAEDLGIKARVYGAAGFAVYWVVTRSGIYEHTEPTSEGYRVRTVFRPGEEIPVRYADSALHVDDLLAAEPNEDHAVR